MRGWGTGGTLESPVSCAEVEVDMVEQWVRESKEHQGDTHRRVEHKVGKVKRLVSGRDQKVA